MFALSLDVHVNDKDIEPRRPQRWPPVQKIYKIKTAGCILGPICTIWISLEVYKDRDARLTDRSD